MLKIISFLLKSISLFGLISILYICFNKKWDFPPYAAFGCSLGAIGLVIAFLRGPFKKEWDSFKLTAWKYLRIVTRKIYSPIQRLFKKHTEERASLSLTQIKDVGIIQKINCSHTTITEDELVREFAKDHLIKKSKLPGRGNPVYLFEYERFFGPSERYIKNKLFSELYERYHNIEFQGIAILSSTKADHKRIFSGTGIDKQPKIQNAIKETIYWDDIILGKNLKQPFFELGEGSKVLILQLMEEGKGFLKKAYGFITTNSNVEVVGMISFFSPLSENFITGSLAEELLIELNLP